MSTATSVATSRGSGVRRPKPVRRHARGGDPTGVCSTGAMLRSRRRRAAIPVAPASMSRPARLPVLLLLLALVALGASARGSGDSSGSGAEATALLKDTFGADHPIRSGRIDANLEVDLKGFAQLADPLSLHLTGPFASNGGKNLPDFALQLDLQSGSRPIS